MPGDTPPGDTPPGDTPPGNAVPGGQPDPVAHVRQDVNARRDAYTAGTNQVVVNFAPSGEPDPAAPRRIWGDVPPRNLGFTGREQLLGAIRAALVSGDRAVVQALRGMGGVGKTQLARRRRVLGEDHPNTLQSAHNLAVGLWHQSEYQAARELDEDTLARSRRVLGEDHPDTLTSAQNLAADLGHLGEYQLARELDEDTLARRRRVLGDEHPDTVQSASNLAADLSALGEAP